mgnify:CR=1 FL=1
MRTAVATRPVVNSFVTFGNESLIMSRIGKQPISIPDKVKVTLSGSRSVLNSIDRVDAVQVDLTDARPYFYFEPQSFGLPAGIEIDVTPSMLTLEWESRSEQKVGVRAQQGRQVLARVERPHEHHVAGRQPARYGDVQHPRARMAGREAASRAATGTAACDGKWKRENGKGTS